MAASTSKKSTTKSAGKKSANSRSSAKSPAKKDPYFDDVTRDIVLIVTLALGILLTIGNFNLGGAVGSAVCGALFGIFGIVQYILPILTVGAVFFIVSNFDYIVAKVKTAFVYVFVIFVSVLTQLIVNGEIPANAVECFIASSESPHVGGGFLGGGLAYLFTEWFGAVGAYVLVIIIFLICIVAVFEGFIFASLQNQSQMHADRASIRRQERHARQELERQSQQARYEARMERSRERIKEEFNRQLMEEQNTEGSRRDRKRSGVTFNATVGPDNYQNSDSVSPVKLNGGIDGMSPEIESTTRSRLTSADKSSMSHHSFSSSVGEPKDVVINIPQPVEQQSQVPSQANVQVTEPQVLKQPEAISKPAGRSSEATFDKASEEAVTREAAENMRKAAEASRPGHKKNHKFPPMSLLNQVKNTGGDSKDYLMEMAGRLEHTLKNFGVNARVTEVTPGPSVTRYEISIAEGTRVTKVVNLAPEIKLNMAVTDVRIEAPIPGKSAIGIEVPNLKKTTVSFRELADSVEFKKNKSKVAICVGKDIGGNVIVGNIEKMPHLLIAGATGSGKSVCINTIIMSILYHASPEDVKLIMVDPKKVELACYNGIPHLLLPVIIDAKKAAGALHWAVKEMTDRYEILAKVGVRNIESYNEKFDSGLLTEEFPDDNLVRMPQIVIILDELADLMMVAANDVEDSIVRLAQLARAAGIHLIIATQRPTANVITGLIKANVPSRIAFSVASGTDSRVILDETGAENLLGNGDMLYAPANLNKAIRVQGAFVSDEEVSRVVEFLKANNDPPEDSTEIAEAIEKSGNVGATISTEADMDGGKDPLFAEAGKLVIENQKGSIGYLQRNFRIGFNRAARIMDQLCEYGVVGPEMGTKPREIKMNLVEFNELLNNM